jgi:hypothetical protein
LDASKRSVPFSVAIASSDLFLRFITRGARSPHAPPVAPGGYAPGGSAAIDMCSMDALSRATHGHHECGVGANRGGWIHDGRFCRCNVRGRHSPPVPKVEVQAYFTEFTRQGPYPFQVCAELPGEIGDPLLILTARSARCIPVEQGELEFCVGVGYDVCSRVVSPSVYDESLQLQFEEHTARHTLEWPDLATTECFDAFKTYICLLGFPRCEENKETPGVYFELPLCYDYCVASHVSCAASLVRMLRPEGRIPGGLLPRLFS